MLSTRDAVVVIKKKKKTSLISIFMEDWLHDSTGPRTPPILGEYIGIM